MNNLKSFMWLLLLLLLVSFSFVGCISSPFHPEGMKSSGFYKIPAIETADTDRFTVLFFDMDPVMDLSESGDGIICWPASIWKDENGRDEIKTVAVNIGRFTFEPIKKMAIILPGGYERYAGSYIAVFNHEGTYIYNQQADVMKVKNHWTSLKPSDYGKFITKIEKGKNCYDLNVNDKLFKGLAQIYQEYRKADIDMSLDGLYKKYGSSISVDRFEQIAKNDRFISTITDWLLNDWLLHATIPFTGIGHMAAMGGLTKILTLPSIGDRRFEGDGYMSRSVTAKEVSEITLRSLAEYGVYMPVSQRVSEKTKKVLGVEVKTLEETILLILDRLK